MATATMAPMGVPTATASGFLALLEESDIALRQHALKKLLGCVDTLWHEVAEALPSLEALAEDTELPLEMRQIAAAVASRVFFHLEEPTQALRLALEAGEAHFDLDRTTPYVERLIKAALDFYIQARKEEEEGASTNEAAAGAELNTDQLKDLVYRMLENCCVTGNYGHALGIALESRETDKVRDILASAKSKGDDALTKTLRYALDTLPTVTLKSFRLEAIAVMTEFLAGQFENGKRAASVDLVHAQQLLGNAAPVSKVFESLFKGSEEDMLLCYQLIFDLVDSGDQAFVKRVADGLKDSLGEEATDEIKARWDQANRVLTGGFSSELSLSFLHKNSQSDRLIMDNLKKALEQRGSSRNSVLHNAAVMTHAYLYAGTTNDSFLRDHLDWMKKASNWSKFSATASLGVIHAGHTTEAMNLLQPYLPASVESNEADGGAPANVSPQGGYAEGGSLFALGIIHGSHAGSSAEKRKETSDFIRNHLRVSHANEVISHGAALGVGLTSFGSCDLSIVNELKELLYTDSAVAGEAAGMAIGMVLVGSGAGNVHNSLPPQDKEEIMETVSELKNYARETQHEKIIRGIAMGIALINFGQEENADAIIEEMRSDRDPILRYGAQYALALAYCGTGSNKAIRILLHTAVSDVSDDVRMAAVIGLAFVLYKTPERVPELVRLLLESFNPHVRYASCMAVGIAMAGTGDSESVALLEPMLEDMTDYVRQGALLGTAMIYMEQSDTSNSRKIRSFRERLTTTIGDKHQSTLTKMGAILSTGILDAGGRNCSLVLGSGNGFTKMTTAVGLALWLQHWHWYPMMHMMSLALTPTLTIGLNKDFKYPKNFEVLCNSKPSVFAYPKKLEEKKEEKKKRVETVTLSTTAKNKARLARKKAKEEGDHGPTDMEVDKEDTEAIKDAGPDEKKEATEAKDGEAETMEIEGVEEKKPKKKREPEPKSFRLQNPSRITNSQKEVCEFDLDQRYRPIRPEEKPFGVVILTDSTPGEAEELEAVKAPSLEPEGEATAPEPFEWTPPAPPQEATSAEDASEPAADSKPETEAESKED